MEATKRAGYRVAKWPYRRPFRVITPDGQNLDLARALIRLDDDGQWMMDERNRYRNLTTTELKARLRSVWRELPTLSKDGS